MCRLFAILGVYGEACVFIRFGKDVKRRFRMSPKRLHVLESAG